MRLDESENCWIEHHQWRSGQLPGDVAHAETRELWGGQDESSGESCLMGKMVWRAEEGGEHAAHKQVPGGSEEEAGRDGLRAVDIVEARWEGKERRSDCMEEWRQEKEASHTRVVRS